MTEILIKTKKLCKTFSNGGNQQHVLKNLDLEIYKGDFTVIMGTSGSGKSTLLYSLSGMDTPSLGEVYFAGKNIAGLTNDQLAVFRRDNCGFVFQQIYLLDTMTILDNVIASRLLVSWDRKKACKDGEELLLKLGLSKEVMRKYPPQLSGGEAQRAGIVRAMINTPNVLFADEPTGSLNFTSGLAVLDLFSLMNEEGQSIVMVTHDLRSAIRGSRILYLQDGVVRGELLLSKYSAQDKERQQKLNQFLREMGW